MTRDRISKDEAFLWMMGAYCFGVINAIVVVASADPIVRVIIVVGMVVMSMWITFLILKVRRGDA